MKKCLIFLMIVVLALGASAKKVKKGKPAAATYLVEKVFNVTAGGNAVTLGQTLTASTVVTINDNGYLMIVDNAKKRRYFVTKKCSLKVKELVAATAKPKNVSKYYLEEMMTGIKRSDSAKYGSSGMVERKPAIEVITGVETDDEGNLKVYIIE